MTHRQIELVQASFRKIEPDAEEAGHLFCKRLFEMDPSLRNMFRGDARDEGRHLMQMIGTVAAGLRRSDQFLPAVEEMMRWYSGYDLNDEYCTKAAAAFLCTLHHSLGETFTPEVCEAWIAMFEKISVALLSSTTPPPNTQRDPMVLTSAA